MAHIHSMARLGRYAEVAACLAEGADANAVNQQGWTPLLLAARDGHTDVVRLLLKAGADPMLAHHNQRTPLHFAAGQGHTAIVGVLLDHGADKDALSRIGCTPMLEAAEFNHRETVEVLRAHGADASRRDRRGRTADELLERGGVMGSLRRAHPDWFPAEDGSRPLARPSTHASVRKQMAEGLTADEYAAKHGRNMLVYSFGRYRFHDAEVQAFAHRVWEVISTPGLLDKVEERYLTGDDLEAARRCRARAARADARGARRGRILPRREEP